MKALTIRQPWASLTLMLDKNGVALKRVETRGHRTNYRGRLAIHAGVYYDPSLLVWMRKNQRLHFEAVGLGTEKAIEVLPRGVILGEVTLADCISIDELHGTEYGTEREKAFGDWRRGLESVRLDS